MQRIGIVSRVATRHYHEVANGQTSRHRESPRINTVWQKYRSFFGWVSAWKLWNWRFLFQRSHYLRGLKSLKVDDCIYGCFQISHRRRLAVLTAYFLQKELQLHTADHTKSLLAISTNFTSYWLVMVSANDQYCLEGNNWLNVIWKFLEIMRLHLIFRI